MTSQIQVESSNSGHPDAGGTENLLTAQVVKKGVSASPYGVDGLEDSSRVSWSLVHVASRRNWSQLSEGWRQWQLQQQQVDVFTCRK